ncbi:hypothetical protein PLANPX_4287 [Lacipirellula parvula]|uniref:PEP-CTERM protein-sorting domain-containing protein n=2 Tax=Lacipirellula parvula TaxID=2650471 RepID=A0A5K7XE54_9BACT|nr:hypothetical protein PLANPX_4287 [Lacipirellula parvula]
MMQRSKLPAHVIGATLVALLYSACPAQADMLLSGFEGDLTSSAGPAWATNLTRSYTAVGATQGATALQLTHGTGWTQDFILDGGAVAPLVAASTKFTLDATTPATSEWRQLFIVMQGAGLGWSQRGPWELPAGVTTPVTLDLQAEGFNTAAAAGDKSWWQIVLIVQGGDTGAPSQITTTIDNIRLNPVPEPATVGLALGGMIGMALVRRRRAA